MRGSNPYNESLRTPEKTTLNNVAMQGVDIWAEISRRDTNASFADKIAQEQEASLPNEFYDGWKMWHIGDSVVLTDRYTGGVTDGVILGIDKKEERVIVEYIDSDGNKKTDRVRNALFARLQLIENKESDEFNADYALEIYKNLENEVRYLEWNISKNIAEKIRNTLTWRVSYLKNRMKDIENRDKKVQNYIASKQ